MLSTAGAATAVVAAETFRKGASGAKILTARYKRKTEDGLKETLSESILGDQLHLKVGDVRANTL